MKLSAWAIRNPIPVVCVIIALTLTGIVSYSQLVVKRLPNIEFPMVQVSITQSGASPTEMETQVTRPIEDALASVPGLRHVSSTINLGSSSTSAEFEIGTDMQKATDDVRTAVERTRVNLPQGIDPPRTQRVDSSSAPILTYAVSAPNMTDAQLSWFVDDVVSRAVQAQPGVSGVSRIGGMNREINVILNPVRLAASGLTAANINDALVGFNRDDTGGRAGIGGREESIRVIGSAETVDRLSELTIPVGGRFLRLGDVATIADGSSEERGFARLDGVPAIAFQVSKTTTSSDVSVEDAVDAEVKNLSAHHPGVAITKVVSTVSDTRASYSATVHVLIEGMVLAALAVFLFLRNWRATLIAAVAMPLSLVPTFSVMLVCGFSLNIVTLLGLTLVIGILVDDAIVEIENIEKRIERGEAPYRAALIGADAIGLAVIATTATIVVVFAPVSFMSGQSGQFFREFGVTVGVAVLFSLLIARFLTPLLAAYFLLPARNPRAAPALPPAYERLLALALRHPWWSMACGGVAVIVAALLAATNPAGFQPTTDAGYFYLNVEGPEGALPADMDRAVRTVSERLRSYPQVEAVFAQVGSTAGVGPMAGGSAGIGSGTVTVVLRHDRDMDTNAFQRSITGMLRTIPDVRITNQGGFGSAGAEIVLTGQDTRLLEQTQMALLKQMRTLAQVVEPRPSPPPASPEIVVKPRPEDAARLGVSTAAIAQAMRVATTGDIDANSAKFSADRQRVPIRVRLPNEARANLGDIAALRIPTASGGTTTLDSVADITVAAGPGQIVRYDRERRVSVQADLNGVTLGEARNAIDQLPIMKAMPAGVREAPIGDAEAMTQLFSSIGIAMGSGILLIYFVLVLLFRSFFKPITILSALPLTMLGAFALLRISGLATTLPVLIGLLMLLGLAAKNSILLVEFAIEEERAGKSLREAILAACHERARPIIMTTVAMAAGMVPTALGLGEGAAFRQPMAVAVIGGLISSTFLSLLLVPAVYELIEMFELRITPQLKRLVANAAE